MTRFILFAFFFGNIVYCMAQDSPNTNRKGMMFSFATGIANSHQKFPNHRQQNTDLALNWKIGYMVNPKLALLLNGCVSIYDYSLSDRPRKRDFGGIFLSIQYHFSEKFWLLGGVGLGTDAMVFYDIKPDNEGELKFYTGVGCITSVGYEIYKRKNFVVDLQARLNYSNVNVSVGKLQGFNYSLLIGINFY